MHVLSSSPSPPAAASLLRCAALAIVLTLRSPALNDLGSTSATAAGPQRAQRPLDVDPPRWNPSPPRACCARPSWSLGGCLAGPAMRRDRGEMRRQGRPLRVLGVAPDAPSARSAAPTGAWRSGSTPTTTRTQRIERFVRLHRPTRSSTTRASAPITTSLPQPRPARNHHHPVPPMVGRVRHGILELSQAETVYLTHSPLALHDADGHTILLPAGARDGDQIFVPGGAYTVVLTVRCKKKS